MANYSFLRGLELPGGEVFEDTNFTQKEPNTPIFVGRTGLTFKKCNLVNCLLPIDSVITQCNTTQISRCSHNHPTWGLAECVDECEHMIDKDTISLDGVVIDTIYVYKDKEI